MSKEEIILTEVEAKMAHDLILNWMAKDKGPIPFEKSIKDGIPIQGYYRSNSYEWTVFKFYLGKRDGVKLYVFQHRDNVQHEGECLRHLEKDTIITQD